MDKLPLRYTFFKYDATLAKGSFSSFLRRSDSLDDFIITLIDHLIKTDFGKGCTVKMQC